MSKKVIPTLLFLLVESDDCFDSFGCDIFKALLGNCLDINGDQLKAHKEKKQAFTCSRAGQIQAF